MHNTYIHTIFTTKSHSSLVNCDASFISVHQKFNNYSLYDAFDTDEKESILNQIPHQPLCSPSHTPWQTEAQRVTNNLAQVPLQAHTACTRDLRGGITF
jgi:hypothetical protein